MTHTTWLHWSGGKDSAYALYKFTQNENVAGLVTSLSTEFRRISMHGVREELLEAQASAIDLPLHKMFLPRDCSMQEYNELLAKEMATLKQLGATCCAFGDIYLEDLRAYRKKQMVDCQLATHFPIWKKEDTSTLARSIIDAGIKAIVVCISGKHFNKSFVGSEYDHAFLNDLPEGVDPCGENGEFHTFVYDAPNFETPVSIQIGDKVDKLYTPASNEDDSSECGAKPSWDTSFYFQDLVLDT